MLYYWVMGFCSDNSVFFGRLKKGCLRDYRRLEKLKSKDMKFHQLLIIAAIFLAACSPKKYVYHFDTYDYNAGRKTTVVNPTPAVAESPLKLSEEAFVASAESSPTIVETNKVEKEDELKSVVEKVNAMSKAERKELKKELKTELKALIKNDVKKSESVDSVKRTKVFDTLAALALAFGVGGIVLITLANISNAFWIAGAIALAIGAFLFVKWVSNGNG